FVLSNYAYVADGSGGLRIVDVSIPSSPTEVGYFDTQGSAKGVYVSGNYGYVADWNDGLRIIDVSNPTNPTEVGYFNTGLFAQGVYVHDNYLYVADGSDGLYILQNDLITDIRVTEKISLDFSLNQNYPNPFNPGTFIGYSIPHDGFVSLKIFDLLGREVKIIVNEFQEAGTYSFNFDASNFPSGIYLYRLNVEDKFTASKKMLLLH
ncbi:MAG: T9SS type A sorting domain-containing protein, partial [Fidelibacterota bacterium]